MSGFSSDSKLHHKHLAALQSRLVQVGGAWTVDDYRTFVSFYSNILPELLQVERCTIFIIEPGSNRICSIFGTGLGEQQIEPPIDGSLVGQVISSGLGIIQNDLNGHHGYHANSDKLTGFVSRNLICSPIRSVNGEGLSGAIQLINKNNDLDFTDCDLQKLDEIAHFLSLSIESVMLNREIFNIASQLGQEVKKLEQQTIHGISFIAESPVMKEVLELVNTVSKAPVNVLIQGENGTGKELIARMIHSLSERSDEKFLAVNCACVPADLIESEFFGHEKGAFTGADQARRGLFEEANGGTLFLDEIGEMPLAIQPKFLRAIQEGEGSRLGSNNTIKYDFRLISACNCDLAKEIQAGRFRQDLFFRLFSIEILLPPLRDRIADILALAQYFLHSTNARFGKHVVGFGQDVVDLFEQYSWPGNVRQLLKEVERLVTLTEDGKMVMPRSCSRELIAFFNTQKNFRRETDFSDLSIPARTKRLEVELIEIALDRVSGNKTKAAALLGITRQGLLKKVKRYGL